MSIRARLFLTYFGIIAIGLGALSMVIMLSFERFFLRTFEDDLRARTTAIAESVADWLAPRDLERVAVVVRRYGAQEQITVRVLDPEGKLLATSDPSPTEWTTDWTVAPGVRAAMNGAIAAGKAHAVSAADQRLFDAQPIVRDGKQLGIVRISRTLAELERQRRTMLATISVTLGIVLVAGAVLCALLARGMARPIMRMRDFAVRVGHGHLQDRLVGVTRHDELGELALELERMRERLTALEGERRAFLANASHELRTPVSNVLVTLQALASGAGEDPELRERFLATASAETERLSRLIKDLLDLGRLEAGVTGLDRVRLPIGNLIDRCAGAIEPRAAAVGVRVHADVVDEVFVRVDPERMVQAIMCIVDNALKFSPPQGTIRITASRGGEISVLDDGPGIDEADLPHIFEQFYTADRSRKRGGTGLGLAIARRIVLAHGGRIAVTSQSGHGAQVSVILPLDDGLDPERAGRPRADR